jgi:nitrogen fixation NifU-like protein
MVTGQKPDDDRASLGKLEVFAGVSEFPTRVKCATLAWHTFEAALHGDQVPVTTE